MSSYCAASCHLRLRRPAGPPAIWICSRHQPPSTAQAFPGRCSPPSARSRAATAPTWGRRAPVRLARCNSCRRRGRAGASMPSVRPARQTSLILTTQFRRPPGCSARTERRRAENRCTTRSSITTTRSGMSTRYWRSRLSTRPTTGKADVAEYDAFLLVSFGGPEGRDDVIPFLENVTAGRAIPRERLEKVAEHYYLFDGISPINQQCRDLIAAIEKDFAARGIALPVYWGNRNWEPYLPDTMARMAADGVGRALAFVTSAYSSYSSCRQYHGDVEAARGHAGAAAPRVDKIRQYFNHPGYISSFAAELT